MAQKQEEQVGAQAFVGKLCEHPTSFGAEIEFHYASLPDGEQIIETIPSETFAESKEQSEVIEALPRLSLKIDRTKVGGSTGCIIESVYAPIDASAQNEAEQGTECFLSTWADSHNILRSIRGKTTLGYLFDEFQRSCTGKRAGWAMKTEVPNSQVGAKNTAKKEKEWKWMREQSLFKFAGRNEANMFDYVQINLDVAQERVKDLWHLSCRLDARILGFVATTVAEELVATHGRSLNCSAFVGFLSQFLLNSCIGGLRLDAEVAGGAVGKNAPGILVKASLQDQLMATLTVVEKQDLGAFKPDLDKLSENMVDKVMQCLFKVETVDATASPIIDAKSSMKYLGLTEEDWIQWLFPVEAIGKSQSWKGFKACVVSDHEAAKKSVSGQMHQDWKSVFDCMQTTGFSKKTPDAGPVADLANCTPVAKNDKVVPPFVNITTKKISVVAEARGDQVRPGMPFASDLPVALLRASALHDGALGAGNASPKEQQAVAHAKQMFFKLLWHFDAR